MHNEIRLLTDASIEHEEDDFLGIGKYAEEISKLIEETATPITFGIYGERGIGKTSFMNLVCKQLSGNSDCRKDPKEGQRSNLLTKFSRKTNNTNTDKNNITTVWFDAWEFSQFNLSGALDLSLLIHLVDEVGGRSLVSEKLKDTLHRITTLTGTALAGHAGAIELAKKANLELLDNLPKNILSLKYSLKKQIKEKYDDKGRVVIFIDNFDRVKPEKMAQTLETMKVFLGVEKTVFVFACDYQTVIQGFREKFMLEGEQGYENAEKLLDKVVQVPFFMPTGQYQGEGFCRECLNKARIPFCKGDNEHDGDDKHYVNLIKNSIGFNPREIKILINTLGTLKPLLREKYLKEMEKKVTPFKDAGSDGGCCESKEECGFKEVLRIQFAILCLHKVFKPVYVYLQRKIGFINDSLFEELFDSLLEEPENLGGNNDKGLRRLKEELNLHKISPIEVAEFMHVFYSAIQLKGDNGGDDEYKYECETLADERLNDNEIGVLREIIKFSSTLAIAEDPENKKVRERQQIKRKIRDISSNIENTYKKFFQDCHGIVSFKGVCQSKKDSSENEKNLLTGIRVRVKPYPEKNIRFKFDFFFLLVRKKGTESVFSIKFTFGCDKEIWERESRFGRFFILNNFRFIKQDEVYPDEKRNKYMVDIKEVEITKDQDIYEKFFEESKNFLEILSNPLREISKKGETDSSKIVEEDK